MSELPLWDFAVQCYAAPGVEAACLELQDRCAGDVPMLLYCLWSGTRSRLLSAADIAHAASLVGTLQSDIISPLRSSRRALRQDLGVPPVLGARVAEIRKRIKSLELDLERCELEWLEILSLGATS